MTVSALPGPAPALGATRRTESRNVLVFAFVLVEGDRLLGALSRLAGSASVAQSEPQFGAGAWATAFDATGVVIAIAAFVFGYFHFRGAAWAGALGTIVLTAAAHHTVLILAALALGRGLGADPVIAATYVATSLPILALAALCWRDAIRRPADGNPP